MATGRSFRQRPLDAHKVLPIVRDETLLDSIEGLPAKDAVKMEIEVAPKADPKVTAALDAPSDAWFSLPSILSCLVVMH